MGKYQDRRLANRVFALASTHAQVVLRQLNASEADAQLYCRLAGSIIYANPSLRADPAILARNRRGQSGLWGYSVSGDLPIVLLQIGDAANIELVRQLVQAHAYWRLKGLAVDLVIWNEDRAGYRQVLQDQIIGLIAAGVETNAPDRPGAIFVRPAEQISSEDRILFQSVARAIITDSRGSLADADRRPPGGAAPGAVHASPGAPRAGSRAGGAAPRRPGVLQRAGRLHAGRPRVHHHDRAGSGDAGALGERAGEPRVRHRRLRERLGVQLGRERPRVPPDARGTTTRSPMPAGRRSTFATRRAAASGRRRRCRPEAAGPYTSRHGFGYSVFEHTEDGITSELWVYVDPTAPVKWSVLKVRNASGRSRRLSATGYVEWVLGDLRGKAAPHVVTTIDPDDRRRVRRERLQRRVRRAHGVLPRGRREPPRDAATAPSSSAATAR